MKTRKNEFVYLFHDNSIMKKSLFDMKNKRLLENLPEKLKILQEKSIIRRKSEQRYRFRHKWDEIVHGQISGHRMKLQKMITSAILIQKNVRGLIVRKKIDPDFITILENKCNILLNDLSNQVEKVLTGIQLIVEPCAVLIQRSYRRYLSCKKIQTWLNYFNFLRNIKISESEICIKHWAKIVSNKQILYNIKFEIFKTVRLGEIKKNLSIITIKKYWIQKNLSFRIFKERIQKYKRRQSLLISREKYRQYLEALNSNKKNDYNEINSSGSDLSSESIDAQYRETEKLKILVKKKIEEKISKGKISYSVKNFKSKMILPVMGEKEMFISNQKRSNSKVFEVTDSSNSKSVVINRNIQIPKRKTVIFSPVKVNCKRFASEREEKTPLVYWPFSQNIGEVKRNYENKSVELIGKKWPTIIKRFTSCQRNSEAELKQNIASIRKIKHFSCFY